MKHLLQAAAVAAVFLVAAPAGAATFIDPAPPATDGSLSWDFGNDGGIPLGAFTDTFDFTFPDFGHTAGSVQATFTSRSNNLRFTAVDFAGHTFHLFNMPGLHAGNLAPLVIPGGLQTLTVHGLSPGVAGSYDGTLTFTPGIPEPATWALMIIGFGAAGAMLRKRRALMAT